MLNKNIFCKGKTKQNISLSFSLVSCVLYILEFLFLLPTNTGDSDPLVLQAFYSTVSTITTVWMNLNLASGLLVQVPVLHFCLLFGQFHLNLLTAPPTDRKSVV